MMFILYGYTVYVCLTVWVDQSAAHSAISRKVDKTRAMFMSLRMWLGHIALTTTCVTLNQQNSVSAIAGTRQKKQSIVSKASVHRPVELLIYNGSKQSRV